MSSDYQEYPEVVQEIRGALNPGRLKLQSTGVVFRNQKTGKVDQFQGSEVTRVQWLKRARGYCLKVTLENGHIHRFDGFKEGDHEKLSSFVQNNYDTKLERVDMSVKGWNWGITKFEGNGLNFAIDNNLAFEIPLNNVSHTTTAKNEVTLEFHQNDDASVSLMELRFHIPSDANNPDSDPVQDFQNSVMENAEIIQATGDAVCVFPEVQCLTPRGRYDLKIFTTFLQLHGKTFDYKIPFTTVLRLFLLPHKDGRQIFFVVSLDPPIKQGQTRYHFMIFLFYKDDEMTIECGLGDELEAKYDGKLTPEMHGLEYEIVSKVFKAVTTRKITVPGSFLGHSATPAISCSYKAATGLLYPLERGFIFVHKPPVHIRFDELAAVNFARSAGSTRSFDFDVETKSGTQYTFSSIEKDEYGKLFDFVKNKNLRMKNIGSKKGGKDYADGDMMDSDNEDVHDAYLERMKAEGKNRDSDAMDDDSDSSDESYNPGASGSEVDEEYDSNPPTTSGSDSDYTAGSDAGGSGSEAERRAEKRKERKEQKERERKSKPKTAKTVREPGTRKPKKEKRRKDPNAPKRPQTGYFIWFMEHREQIKEDNPSLSMTELAKKAGELWKAMTADDKKEYDVKYQEGKVVYQKQMEEYKKKKAEEGSESEGEGEEKSPKQKKPKAKAKSNPKEKKPKTKAKSKSPKKSVSDSRMGAGSNYKSKEYISSDGSSSSNSDSDEKPLKKKAKKEASAAKKEAKKEASDAESGSDKESPTKSMKSEEGSSSEEDAKPLKTRSKRKGGSDSDAGELPEEEDILSSPEVSEQGSASGSESN